MKTLLLKVAAVVSGILAVLVWSAALSLGQLLPVQDCCGQAIKYKADLDRMTLKYTKAIDVLEETRKAGDDVQDQKDKRIRLLQDEANRRLTRANDTLKLFTSALVESNQKNEAVQKKIRTELIKRRPFWMWFRRRAWLEETLELLE